MYKVDEDGGTVMFDCVMDIYVKRFIVEITE